MKRMLVFGIALLVLGAGVFAYFKLGHLWPHTDTRRETSGPKSSNNEAQANETEIQSILENYYALARTRDRNAVSTFSREISAPEYSYSSELGAMNKKELDAHFESLKLEYLSADFDDLTIQSHGSDFAVAKYRDLSTVRMNGETVAKPRRFTNVWVRRDRRWLIVAEHSSVIVSVDQATALPSLR